MKIFGFPNIKAIFKKRSITRNINGAMAIHDIEKCQKQKDENLSFTKKIVTFVLISGVLWVWCSYVLAFLGRIDIAESLSSQVVTVILGTGLGYFLKSLIENLSKYHSFKSISNNGQSPLNIINNIQDEVQNGMTIDIEENGETIRETFEFYNNGEKSEHFEEPNFVDINVNNLPQINTQPIINEYSNEYRQNKYNEYINNAENN